MAKQEGELTWTSQCSGVAAADSRGSVHGWWRWGGGYDEKGIIYCVLMSSFDVPPLLAVCTPGSLLLDSDWLSAAAAGGTGGAAGGRGRGVGGGVSIFQVTRSSQLLLPGVGRQ